MSHTFYQEITRNSLCTFEGCPFSSNPRKADLSRVEGEISSGDKTAVIWGIYNKDKKGYSTLEKPQKNIEVNHL